MTAIPVHTASPINANTPLPAFGASPSTAAARYTPVNGEARSTSASPSPNPARPGAAAVPRPTNTAASSFNNRFEPTPTASLQSAAIPRTGTTPPSPQPGAVPSPYSASPTFRVSEPARPRPLEIPGGDQYTRSDGTPPRVTAVPSQSHTPAHTYPLPAQPPSSYGTIYTPTRSVPPAGITSTSASPSCYNYASPTFLFPQASQGPHAHQMHHDLSHPPGYQQDHHSSFDDKPVEFCQETDYRATLSPLSTSSSRRRGAGGGILDMDWTFGGSPNGSSSGGGNNNNDVVKTAMSWARAAGKKLSMTEKQIWKSINGEDGS